MSTTPTGRVTENRNNLLNVNYTTPSLAGSFGAAQSLKRHTKRATLDDAKRYLVARDAYTLNRQRRVRFPRRKTCWKGIADLYQADLADLTNISSYNVKYRFLLTVIDVFSKKAWVEPLLSKSADRVTDAFDKVLSSAPKCAMLQTDRGTEFLNDKFQSILRRHGIHFYTSEN